jgi:hypothetical protein
MPAKAAPMVRSDSRRDTDTASDLDSTSRRSIDDTSLLKRKWMVTLTVFSSAVNTNN